MEWLKENIAYPYPTNQQREHLCRATGLTRRQLRMWLIDARRRKVPSMRKMQGIDMTDKGSKYGRKKGEKMRMSEEESSINDGKMAAPSSIGDHSTQVEKKKPIEERIRLDITYEGLFKYYDYCTCGVSFLPKWKILT
ncbi:unnamed protein product [Moneuplotes crassus]|uniref:Homeobox domain-containing protein n=1 Tax=Euplotes crassus TaxID=5936 RepID=A0AAD1UJU5_EUPCR|nr:unnamed protein product [Moneuplotes crassus]